MIEKKVDLLKIKNLRKTFNFSLEDMAKKLGYDSPNGYYYLESGRSKFSAEALVKVADIFNISIEELFLNKRLPKWQ